MLSGKGSAFSKTDRRLAQKQPSFKESVIAHCSTPQGAEKARQKCNEAKT